jgi:hypothetical protein
MYPECILQDTRNYLECILMYLKCILHALLHFKRIHVSACILHVSQTSPRYILGYTSDNTSDTSRYMYLHGRFLGVTLELVLDTCQDTSRYMYLGLFFTIHHDTSRYIWGTCGIHAGYMRDTCICKGDQDTCGIHPKYMMRNMYLKLISNASRERCI